MTVHIEALDLWKAVKEDYEVTPLGDNPTVNQIRHHKERKTRKAKAKECLFSARMKESETIKDYANQLLDLANKVRLSGKNFTNERIIQKILVTLPEKYEATISSLENSKDLSSITLAELVNALQALEQRRIMRKEGSVEGVFQAKSQNKSYEEKKKNQKQRQGNNYNNQRGSNPPCPHCKKTNHSQQKCWWIPDVKCNKYGQLGHVERVWRSQTQQEEAKAAVNHYEEE
ncbi:uncharacterized protein LOC107876789 [Capsicum annuum]|uniref:uncharacterized protein LOC107876789 n=1 Tax=Capsicum annuum TaxID=4072 RepID=UPI001FB0C810|nr:uncharacterized protein LOC107876789 [Capsicum annuum]